MCVGGGSRLGRMDSLCLTTILTERNEEPFCFTHAHERMCVSVCVRACVCA